LREDEHAGCGEAGADPEALRGDEHAGCGEAGAEALPKDGKEGRGMRGFNRNKFIRLGKEGRGMQSFNRNKFIRLPPNTTTIVKTIIVNSLVHMFGLRPAALVAVATYRQHCGWLLPCF
jgi:hypothetical protein